MKKNLIIVVAIVISMGILGASIYLFSRNNNSTKNQDAKLKVATTIFPLYDIAQNITGDKAEVVQIFPTGASPHTYEPTIKDREKLKDTDIVFAIGHNLDNKAIELADSINHEIEIVIVDKNISFLHGQQHEHSNDEETSAHDNEEDHMIDPHYWNSATNAIQISQNIYETLVENNPQNQDSYKNNLENYTSQLTSLVERYEPKFATLNKNELITFHSGFSYFANELNLKIVATVEKFPGNEPSAQYIKTLGETIRSHNITTLFKEPQLADSLLQSLSDDYGVDIKTLDPLGGTENRKTFIENYQKNADIILEVLENL